MIFWVPKKILGVTEITGRGTCLLLDLEVNGLIKSKWVEDILIKVGHGIDYEGELYEITGIESMANLMDGKINHKVGLIVKKL